MSEFNIPPSFIPAIPAKVPLLEYKVPSNAGTVRIYKGSVDERDMDKAIRMSAPMDLLKEIVAKPPAPSPVPEMPKEDVLPKTAPVISCKSCADLKRENRLLSKALALMSIKLMGNGDVDE